MFFEILGGLLLDFSLSQVRIDAGRARWKSQITRDRNRLGSLEVNYTRSEETLINDRDREPEEKKRGNTMSIPVFRSPPRILQALACKPIKSRLHTK